MGITLQWDNPEKTILRQSFEGKWTWEEFYEVCGKETPALIRTVSHQVHVLSDFTNSGPLPFGGAMTHARSVMKYFPDNWGILVVISDSGFIRAMVNAYRKVFFKGWGQKTYSAVTLKDAYHLTQEQSTSNDPSSST